MRDPYDAIASGPFRCEIHRAAVKDAAADLIAMPAPAPTEPVGGVSTGPATSVWSGGRERPQRSSNPIADAMAAGLKPYVVMDTATADALMLAARVYVGAVWDHAVAVVAEAGPLPIAGAKPWVEWDAEYRERLRGIPRRMLWTWDELDGDELTNIGEEVGLPRSRLVPVEAAHG